MSMRTPSTETRIPFNTSSQRFRQDVMSTHEQCCVSSLSCANLIFLCTDSVRPDVRRAPPWP